MKDHKFTYASLKKYAQKKKECTHHIIHTWKIIWLKTEKHHKNEHRLNSITHDSCDRKLNIQKQRIRNVTLNFHEHQLSWKSAPTKVIQQREKRPTLHGIFNNRFITKQRYTMSKDFSAHTHTHINLKCTATETIHGKVYKISTERVFLAHIQQIINSINFECQVRAIEETHSLSTFVVHLHRIMSKRSSLQHPPRHTHTPTHTQENVYVGACKFNKEIWRFKRCIT